MLHVLINASKISDVAKIKLCNYEFETVNKFEYLGGTIANNGDERKERSTGENWCK